VVRPAETDPRETNRLAMTLAPHITGLPAVVVRDGAGTVTFNVAFHPALRAGQTVALVLGDREYTPQTFTAPVSSLGFVVENAPVGNHLARLRIDGIDSPVIDRTATPPRFMNQRIEIQ
jgi:hypothetical protein